MQTSIKIFREAFVALFQPQPNQLDAQASHDFGAGGTMYEPFGAQLEYVQNNDAQSIWTICYGGSNGGRDDYIVSGYHHDDRIGHIITKQPVPDDVQITIDLPNADLLWRAAENFKYLHQIARGRVQREVENAIPEFYEWEFDECGLTDLTDNSEGTQRYLVMIDMHS
jgi:hypothetical protein